MVLATRPLLESSLRVTIATSKVLFCQNATKTDAPSAATLGSIAFSVRPVSLPSLTVAPAASGPQCEELSA
jgi:hypothetical protein